jgi:hypothetical protein
VQKKAYIKYQVYKIFFTAVLCAFFFVQTQAAFIARAYNDGSPGAQGSFLKKNHSAGFYSGAKKADGCHAWYKINKRYQPATTSALLPAACLIHGFLASVSKEWVPISSTFISSFIYCRPLRGPPSFWQNR